MRFLHTADLHLGKRLGGLSLRDEQAHMLSQLLSISRTKAVDGIFISGDLFDRATPSVEAVNLLDTFLRGCDEQHLPVYCISGNHDSQDRLAFGSSLFSKSNIHFSPAYHGSLQQVVLQDKFGPLTVTLLPFLKPAMVRDRFPDAEVNSYTQAIYTALSNTPLDTSVRNVLLAHQFVVGSQTAGSEELIIGGVDQVDAAVFDRFDYVALGHIHRGQSMNGDRLRYPGTPLKYDVKEAGQEKSVSIITLGEKGSLTVETVPITPLRDLKALRGTYLELTYCPGGLPITDDFVSITLTDESDIPEAVGKLRGFYPNLVQLNYDNRRTKQLLMPDTPTEVQMQSPDMLFTALYETQNNGSMTTHQQQYIQKLIQHLQEVSQ